MTMRLVAFALAFALALLGAAQGLQAAKFSVETSDEGAVVQIDGKLFTEYLTQSGPKPVLWPIIGPTGKPMTRAYPIAEEKVEGERHDHVHHRSFWFTHGDVNGVDFWSETEGKHGTIKHRKFAQAEARGDSAVIVTENDWLGPDGKKICQDVRTLTFGADEEKRWIDFEAVVQATEGEVTFGDTKEGSFGVRVAGTMKVTAGLGGKIVNSEGQTDQGAWGKRAAWVDYHGPVGKDKERLGIAILNHPSSFRFPTYWHVRTYGLFTANPFGLHNFLGKKAGQVKGAHTIPAGETMTLRYRVIFHTGDQKQADIAGAFAKYAK